MHVLNAPDHDDQLILAIPHEHTPLEVDQIVVLHYHQAKYTIKHL